MKSEKKGFLRKWQFGVSKAEDGLGQASLRLRDCLLLERSGTNGSRLAKKFPAWIKPWAMKLGIFPHRSG